VKTIRAAIVGAGVMGRWHATTARQLGHSVRTIYDADDARARALATPLGAAPVSALADALIDVDVVHICTPMSTHAAIARQALVAGCSVICEKPLAASADDVRMLYQLAQREGRLLVPTHQFLFQRGMVELTGALVSLGQILHVETLACTAGASDRDENGAESVALDVMPHPLSITERLLPGALEQIAWYVGNTPRGELHAAGSFAGASVDIRISCAGRPPANQLRVVCRHGTASVDLFHGFAVFDRGGVSRREKITRPFSSSGRTFAAATANLVGRTLRREPAYPGLRELIGATYAAVAEGQQPPIAARESIAVADACARIADIRAAQFMDTLGARAERGPAQRS